MIKRRLFNRPSHRWISYLVLALFLTVCTAITVWTQQPGGQANTPSKPLVFTANIQNRGGSTGIQNTPVTIYLNEFSTPEEVKDLVEMLQTRGVEPVVNKLASMDRGRFSPVGRVGPSALGMIRSINTPTGQVIRALASRQETWRELYGMERSSDYPFGFLELRVDKDGKGEGSLIMAAKINFNKEGMLQMESFDEGQLRLVNVRLQK